MMRDAFICIRVAVKSTNLSFNRTVLHDRNNL